MKRSQQKRITKEAVILRHMRIERGLSLNQAGAGVGITGSAIAHIEQGRMDASRKRIETMVEACGACDAREFHAGEGGEVRR